eukprot:294954-Rhodomonas_salina.2
MSSTSSSPRRAHWPNASTTPSSLSRSTSAPIQSSFSLELVSTCAVLTPAPVFVCDPGLLSKFVWPVSRNDVECCLVSQQAASCSSACAVVLPVSCTDSRDRVQGCACMIEGSDDREKTYCTALTILRAGCLDERATLRPTTRPNSTRDFQSRSSDQLSK